MSGKIGEYIESSAHSHVLQRNRDHSTNGSFIPSLRCDKCSGRIAKAPAFKCSDEDCEFDMCAKCVVSSFVKNTEAPQKVETVWIHPGDPDSQLQLRDLFDERSSDKWDLYRKDYAGKVVFSSSPIDPLFDKGTLSDAFKPGQEIFGRAVWPRAIRNYPIGYQLKGDEKVPVYGPTKILADTQGYQSIRSLDLFMYVSIDNTEISRKLTIRNETVEGPVNYTLECGPRASLPAAAALKAYEVKSETTDFYAYNQSIRVHLVKDTIDESTWQSGCNFLRKKLYALPAGEHKVKVDLRYRIFVDDSINDFKTDLPDEEKQPLQTTLISVPIATGEFTFTVSGDEDAALLHFSPFPSRKTDLSSEEAEHLEKLMFEWLTTSDSWGARGRNKEVPLHAAAVGNWVPLRKQHKCHLCCSGQHCPDWEAEPLRHSINMNCTFYRSVRNGWQVESAVVFKLSLTAYSTSPQTKADVAGVGVGGSYELEIDGIPDSYWQKIGVKRG